MKKIFNILYLLIGLAVLFTFVALIVRYKSKSDEQPFGDQTSAIQKIYTIDKDFTIDSYNQPWHIYFVEETKTKGIYSYRIKVSVTNNRKVATDTSRHTYELYNDSDVKIGDCYNILLTKQEDGLSAEIAASETATGYLYCDPSSKASKFRIKAVTGGIYHEDTKKVDYDYKNYDIDIE